MFLRAAQFSSYCCTLGHKSLQLACWRAITRDRSEKSCVLASSPSALAGALLTQLQAKDLAILLPLPLGITAPAAIARGTAKVAKARIQYLSARSHHNQRRFILISASHYSPSRSPPRQPLYCIYCIYIRRHAHLVSCTAYLHSSHIRASVAELSPIIPGYHYSIRRGPASSTAASARSLPGAPKLSRSPRQPSETFQQPSSRLVLGGLQVPDFYLETVGRPRPFVIVQRGAQGFAAR